MSAIPTLPTPPLRSMGKAAFNAAIEPWIQALYPWTDAANAYEQTLALAAQPGGIVMTFTFDASTSDSDPGNGKVRFNNATQNATTTIRFDLLDNLGSSSSGRLATLMLSTSQTKGYMRVWKASTPNAWITFGITGVTAMSGYANVAVSVVDANTSFSAGDALTFSFSPKGDQGDIGPMSTWTNVLSAPGNLNGLSQITFSSLPAGYSDIAFTFQSVTGATHNMRMAISTDGTTFTAPQAILLGLNSADVAVTIHDYRGDHPIIVAGASVYTNTSPSMGSLVDTYVAGVKATGGIVAVRFSPDSGTWQNAIFGFQPRAR